jgi:hypothetical protein
MASDVILRELGVYIDLNFLPYETVIHSSNHGQMKCGGSSTHKAKSSILVPPQKLLIPLKLDHGHGPSSLRGNTMALYFKELHVSGDA